MGARTLTIRTALLTLPLLVACRAAGSSVQDSNRLLVRRFLEEVFNTGDVAAVPVFVSPDYVEVYGNVRHPVGIEGARRHVLGVREAFPDLEVTVQHQIAEGEWVASQITARGTHRAEWLGMAPTGRVLEFTGVNLDRVVDGRIVEHVGAANLFAPLLEAGALRVVGPGEDSR